MGAACERVPGCVDWWWWWWGGDQLLLTSNGKSGRGVFCRRWRRASGSGIGGGGGGAERQGWKQSLASINRVGLLPW